ncbi:MAG: hypothetical protein H6597_05750 [Flavobacteriales bacterium]|nr:hypothetical protein [Flavobacteriales bacterium]
MKLDRHTYEAWLLDRIDGRLTTEQERALDAFLTANPDLPALQEVLPGIDAGAVPFPGTDALKRAFPPIGAPDAYHLDDFLVARVEGDLTMEQERALDRYLLAHPGNERDARLVMLTRIVAAGLVVPSFGHLTRHQARIIPLFVRFAAAAAVAALFSIALWSVLRGDEPTRRVQVAELPTPDIDNAIQKAHDSTSDVSHEATIDHVDGGSTDKIVRVVRPGGAPGTDVHPAPSDPASSPRTTRESWPQLAEARPVHPAAPMDPRVPVAVDVPEQAIAAVPDGAELAYEPRSAPTVAEFVLGTVRERVLDRTAAPESPLGKDDAVAAVNKGLKRIGGSEAGVHVERTGQRITHFDLRLGRGLGVTASRGR